MERLPRTVSLKHILLQPRMRHASVHRRSHVHGFTFYAFYGNVARGKQRRAGSK